MRKIGLVMGVLLASTCLISSVVHAATATLNGTQWSIKITPDEAAKKAGEKASKDTVIFKGGQMTSTACVKYGFTPSSYTATGAETGPSFQTEQVSPKEGKMTWSGQVSGNTITGTAAWTKKNGQVLHYTFSGKPSTKS